MATELQKNLAHNIIKNAKRKKPLNKKQLVISSGYGEVTADRHAPEVIEQKGVQEELAALGFHPDNAKRVVAEILNDGKFEHNRLKAADMVFEVHGSYAPTKSVNLNVTAKHLSPKEREIGEKYEAELMQAMLEDEED